MEKPAPNFKLLVLSAILFLVGVGNLVFIVVSSASSFNQERVRIEMPGVATVQLPESGLQQVFHEWKNSSEPQIGNLTLAVTDQQGKKLEVQPLEGVSYRVNDTSGQGVFQFQIDTPGAYQIEGTYPGGTGAKVQLAIVRDFAGDSGDLILKCLVGFSLPLVLALSCMVFGLKPLFRKAPRPMTRDLSGQN